MKGLEPQGPERGDTEKWIFPKVTLTEKEKKEIVATVVKIGVVAMFRMHLYTFGGKYFLQSDHVSLGCKIVGEGGESPD